jgi:tRNA(Ile2)-agmatinylcytidine synthase
LRYYLGLDSTDSIKGGCTTWTFSKIIDRIYELDGLVVFNDYPRLIRLNPNIPFKTRGNAALSISFDCSLAIDDLLEECKSVIIPDIEAFKVDEKQPGMILTTDNHKDERLYEQALQHMIELENVPGTSENFVLWPEKNQSHIGAYAALNSNLSNDFTYELIAYRQNNNFGEFRQINPENIVKLTSKYRTTFSSFDMDGNRELIAPSGPDPIFCGIRGENVMDLLLFYNELVIEEDIASWSIFKTNQGTNAHTSNTQCYLKEFSVISCHARVVSTPMTIQGGHVNIRVNVYGQTLNCMTFEPTKKLRNVARQLIPGDMVYIHGNVRNNQFGINIALEYFYITSLVPKILKKAPDCRCGKRMTSAGKFKGYKCKFCDFTTHLSDKVTIPRKIFVGQKAFASLSAQRHLTRPVKRIHLRNREEPTLKHYKDFRYVYE